MGAPLTVLLAGQMCRPWVDWIGDRVTTDWIVTAWDEDQPFERFAALAPQADAIVGGRIKGAWPAVPKLRLYQIPFTGYDWIGPADVPPGCTVCNAYGHEIAIAEYVLAGILEWEIGLLRYDRDFREKGWQGRLPGVGPSHGEVSGKTLGVIGYGHIGAAAAERAAAFGMRTVAVSRTPRAAPVPLHRLDTMEGLDRLLSESDYVLMTLPLASETRSLLDARRLGLMKPDALLVNVGRAPTIDEAALHQALAEHRIRGAILDVWYGYPTETELDRPPSRYKFQELDNVVMTPHCSSRSAASRIRRWETVPRNLDRLARGEPLANACFTGVAN